MANSVSRTILVYGATGRSGRLVVERALAEGWAVSAFVRNPDKLPAALRAKVTVVKGDLSDGASVAAAVRSSKPDAIVDASSALRIGQAKGAPANDADRGVITKATLEALEADGRLADCVVIIVGGQLLPEPGGTIDKASVAALAWVLRNVFARKAWREMEAWMRWCFQDTPPAFRFVYVRMGSMVEEPSRGALCVEPTPDNIPRGKVSYCDVADALVALAGDTTRAWERKAVFFNYPSAKA